MIWISGGYFRGVVAMKQSEGGYVAKVRSRVVVVPSVFGLGSLQVRSFLY
jgi:hypothetical protein